MRRLKESIKACMSPEMINFIQTHIIYRNENKEITKKIHAYKDMENIKFDLIINYVQSLRQESFRYKFSNSCHGTSLYASVYACMILDLLTENINDSSWCDFFDTFQDSDGFFHSSELDTPGYKNGEHWGDRHLAAHMVIPYAKRNRKFRHEFTYIREYRNPDKMIYFLKESDWSHPWRASNAIMNLGVLLQYSRDYMGMDFYGDSIAAMEEWLIANISPISGLWHKEDLQNSFQILEAIRGAYHIYPLLLYDRIIPQSAEKVIDHILSVQNRWGGFHTSIISSACADIDALDLLVRMGMLSNYRKEDIEYAMQKSYKWLLCNQTSEGGFMFEYNRPFMYGDCNLLTSKAREANLFATWFRLLNIIILREYLLGEHVLSYHIPGYELCLEALVK